MTTYAYNPHTGELIQSLAVADWMGTTTVEPPAHDSATESCIWDGDAWEVRTAESAPVIIPSALTMRQARLALLSAGLLDDVEAAIAALPEPQKSAAKIEWEYSQEVQRHNSFVSLLAPGLGLTELDLDQMFVAASKL